MATRYQVRLLDTTGAQVGVITDWRQLEYTRLVNNVGGYTLRMDGEDDRVDLFTLDGLVEIVRGDIAASPQIPLYTDFVGLHRDTERATNEQGLSTYQSQGVSLEDLIARRVIAFRTATAGAVKSGAGETVMKDYVDENAGPGATSPPRIASGVTPAFTIQADGGAGSTWAGDRAFKKLLDVVREIAEATTVDFEVVAGATPYSFVFNAKARPIGTDRSVGNAAGTPPVTFALGYGNMGAPRYTQSRRGEKNRIVVLGQGQPGSREVVTRESGADSDSPLNLIEVVKNANQEATTAALNNVGDAALETLQARDAFTFEVIQTESARYGRDYFLGDIVTGVYKTIQQNVQIVGVNIIVEPGIGEQINVVLSNVA